MTLESILTSRSRCLRWRRRPLRPKFKSHCRTSLRASKPVEPVMVSSTVWATNWKKRRTNKEQTWSSNQRVENTAFTIVETSRCRKFPKFYSFMSFHDKIHPDNPGQSRRSKEARARVEELMESLKSMLTSEVWLPWSTWSQFSREKWTKLPSFIPKMNERNPMFMSQQ